MANADDEKPDFTEDEDQDFAEDLLGDLDSTEESPEEGPDEDDAAETTEAEEEYAEGEEEDAEEGEEEEYAEEDGEEGEEEEYAEEGEEEGDEEYDEEGEEEYADEEEEEYAEEGEEEEGEESETEEEDYAEEDEEEEEIDKEEVARKRKKLLLILELVSLLFISGAIIAGTYYGIKELYDYQSLKLAKPDYFFWAILSIYLLSLVFIAYTIWKTRETGTAFRIFLAFSLAAILTAVFSLLMELKRYDYDINAEGAKQTAQNYPAARSELPDTRIV